MPTRQTSFDFHFKESHSPQWCLERMLPPKRFPHSLRSLRMEGGLALGPLVTKSPQVFGIQPVSLQPWSNRTQEEQLSFLASTSILWSPSLLCL